MAGINLYGELIRAQFENLSSDPSQGLAGRMWLNTTSHQPVIDNGVSVRQVICDRETIPNYLAWAQISTPSSPGASKNFLYFKSDDNLYSKNSAGTETQIATFIAPVVVQSKTADYTALTTDNVILCDASSAGFTITLFAASTVRVLKIKKTDSDYTKAVTISDGGSFSTTLNTQNEEVELLSDGSAWSILNRRIPSVWTAYIPTFGGAGTVTNISCFWRRVGDSMDVMAYFKAGICTGTAASVTWPSGLATNSSVPGQTIICGWGGGTTNHLPRSYSVLVVGGFSDFRFGDAFAAALAQTTGATVWNDNNFEMFMAFGVPISGWNS